jgi:hypothetical protein
MDISIFGGTQKYFGGTSGFRGTQVEKHWSSDLQSSRIAFLAVVNVFGVLTIFTLVMSPLVETTRLWCLFFVTSIITQNHGIEIIWFFLLNLVHKNLEAKISAKNHRCRF